MPLELLYALTPIIHASIYYSSIPKPVLSQIAQFHANRSVIYARASPHYLDLVTHRQCAEVLPSETPSMQSVNREKKHTWHLRPELDLTSLPRAPPVSPLLAPSLSRFCFNVQQPKMLFCWSRCDSGRIESNLHWRQ